jgi:Protein of unknown function (DUF2971)
MSEESTSDAGSPEDGRTSDEGDAGPVDAAAAFGRGMSDLPSLWTFASPRELYHYTGLDGLVGIVTDRAIWATDARYLNDASELAYAADLIETVIVEAFSEVPDATVKDALPSTPRPGFANPFEYLHKPFVVCFCEEPDLLSQWRGYGEGTTRYSLGLEVGTSWTTGHDATSPMLLQVIYDEQRQRALVEEVVDRWLAILQDLLDSGHPRSPLPGMPELQQALALHHLCFKHPAFKDEREWRLVKLVNADAEVEKVADERRAAQREADNERYRQQGIEPPIFQDPPVRWPQADGIDILFRPSPLGLVPYIKLPLAGEGPYGGNVPLKYLIQGPNGSDPALEAVERFLKREGAWMAQVRNSGVPLR